MMAFNTLRFANARMDAELDRAERRRLPRQEVPASRGNPVFDAVGHGLIAVGSRLVSDPGDHSGRRHAA